MDTPIRNLFNFGAEIAQHMFDKQGYLRPMWIGVNKKRSHIPIMAKDMSDKDLVAKVVRAFLKKEDAIRYVSMLECWLVEGKKEIPKELLEGGSLEHNPDRREAIHIFAEDNEGNSLSGYFYILRPEHGKPKLSPIKMGPKGVNKGRFVGMLS